MLWLDIIDAIFSLGGAFACLSLHVGQIQPGGLRGNHRHHTCNETFVIWGAKTKFRLENADVKDKGYGEAIIAADEVGIVASTRSTAHALINMDVQPTFFIGCQDTTIYPNSSNTDYKVWKDLWHTHCLFVCIIWWWGIVWPNMMGTNGNRLGAWKNHFGIIVVHSMVSYSCIVAGGLGAKAVDQIFFWLSWFSFGSKGCFYFYFFLCWISSPSLVLVSRYDQLS